MTSVAHQAPLVFVCARIELLCFVPRFPIIKDDFPMCHGSAGAVILWGSLLAARVFAEDWTEFRGPTGQGHSTATGLPTRWTRTDNVAWMHEIPGKGWSS